jgi:ketosteroid isomerase-like protein
MTSFELGTKLVALVNAGKNQEVMDTLYATDIVSVEAGAPPGQSPEVRGVAACHEKRKQFHARMEVHKQEAEGPFPHGDRFAVLLRNDVTPKAGGPRMTMTEVALYTVKDDKIVREEFFYKLG